jgi:hypothetical protein
MASSSGAEREMAHYQSTFTPLMYGVILAIVLTLLLRETGPNASGRRRDPVSEPATS